MLQGSAQTCQNGPNTKHSLSVLLSLRIAWADPSAVTSWIVATLEPPSAYVRLGIRPILHAVAAALHPARGALAPWADAIVSRDAERHGAGLVDRRQLDRQLRGVRRSAIVRGSAHRVAADGR